jgi:hypothetical protein
MDVAFIDAQEYDDDIIVSPWVGFVKLALPKP